MYSKCTSFFLAKKNRLFQFLSDKAINKKNSKKYYLTIMNFLLTKSPSEEIAAE